VTSPSSPAAPSAAVDPAAAVRRVLDDAVQEGRTPGAAAVVRTAAGRRLAVTAGTLHPAAGALPVRTDTVWDLASVTKLLSTTLLTADLVARGLLSLDEAPWPHWPGVTVAHVLRHDAGLPAWRPFFREALPEAGGGGPIGVVGTAEQRAAILAAVHATPPVHEPGAVTVYSDVGFLALGALLEARAAAPLDALFADVAEAAYGKTGLRFVGLAGDGFHPGVPNVAPTERCSWRRRALIGQVHDDNAFAMGGVAGHAGLFGSLEDVERAGTFLLSAVASGSPGPEGASVERGMALAAHLRAFATPPSPSLSGAPVAERALGFDRATSGGSTDGALSARAVGHLGYTGTSLWIDPGIAPEGADAAAYVLLTNHVHFGRDPTRIKGVRQAFHRAARAWVEASIPP
jgi:CubicO group peptidase (beta-lactamase class C family)